MLLYRRAHMDFSYFENRNNFSILRLLYGERHITGTGFRAVKRAEASCEGARHHDARS